MIAKLYNQIDQVLEGVAEAQEAQAALDPPGERLDLDENGQPYGPPRIDVVPNRTRRRDNMRLKGIRRSLRSRIQRKRGRKHR